MSQLVPACFQWSTSLDWLAAQTLRHDSDSTAWYLWPRTAAVVFSGWGSQSSADPLFPHPGKCVAWSLQMRLDWAVWASSLGVETLGKEDREGVEVAIIYHPAALPLLSFCQQITPTPHSPPLLQLLFWPALQLVPNWQLFLFLFLLLIFIMVFLGTDWPEST